MKDYFSRNRSFVDLIPSNLRDETNTSLMQNLFDRFLTKDESIPMFGYIGKNSVADPIQRLPQIDQDREINQLISTYVFSTGNQKHYFTPHDFLLKLNDMGVRSPQQWLSSTANNYAPPIELDKFVNFYEYYWVASAVKNPPSMSWNKTNSPEYYTIAKPSYDSYRKLNAAACADEVIGLTGSGYYDMEFVVQFQSALEYTITAVGNTFGLIDGETQSFTLREPPTDMSEQFIVDTAEFVSGADVLLTVKFTRELVEETSTYYQRFYQGDQFRIDSKFLSSIYSVRFNGSSGDLRRGGISSVRTITKFQTIDGYTVREGDRVLVTVGPNRGIYEVSTGAWTKAKDSTDNEGDIVYCANGSVYGGMLMKYTNSLWISQGASDPLTNEWQENNFWVHRSTFDGQHNYDMSKIEQARRPIIEFWDGLELNSSYDGFDYVQRKQQFNQIPMFNLYEYDGTKSNIVSPIFFYVESPNSDIDVLLQKRVKKTDSEDFIFNHGLFVDNKLRFYKHDGKLKTIWAPGYSSSSIIKTSFNGTGDGSIEISAKPNQQQQILSITYIGDNKFKIISSKYHDPIDTVVVGVDFDNIVCSGKISVGNVPFVVGDVFLVMVSGQEQTRTFKMVDGAQVGSLDASDTIKHPRMFTHNPLNEVSDELSEGTLYGHFRSILINQIDKTKPDITFGGSVKSWSAPVSLLSSLLMQRDVTPLSLIDFAKREYGNALNNINELYFVNVLKYLQSAKSIHSGISVSDLTDYILEIVKKDNKTTTTFSDTTSGVPGFPISLAKMGFVPAVIPDLIFDGELSSWFIQHHDGHLEPAFVSDDAFLELLFEKRVKAIYPDLISDFQTVEPTPSKAKIWRFVDGTVNKIKVFCVEVSSQSTPAPMNSTGELLWANGDIWHQQGTNKIFQFDTSLRNWKQTTLSHTQFWKDVDFAEILNQVLLEVETRLYENTFSFKTATISPSAWNELPYADLLRDELASWAFENKLDPSVNNFSQSNAFTWNYRNASIAGVTGQHARWFNLLKAHQATSYGVIPTERPDLYPWMLLGYQSKPSDWDQLYAAEQPAVNHFTSISKVNVVETNPSAIVYGTRIIDNLMIKAGDMVIVTNNYIAARNGLWEVTNAEWVKHMKPVSHKFEVVGGSQLHGSEWFTSPTGEVLQLRSWTTKMWQFIKNQRPGLQLSVNIHNDKLLPPYVNPAISASAEALLTTIPTGITLPFVFGEQSPVESIWMKSIEFPYALAKSFFRYDPIAFLTELWGVNFISTNGVVLDSSTLSPFNVQRMARHGTAITPVSRTNACSFDSMIIGSKTITATMIGNNNYKQVFSVSVDGSVVGMMYEGVAVNTTFNGVVLNNFKIDDFGVPFNIGDTFTFQIPHSAVETTFTPAKFVIQNGFGQILPQALLNLGIDSSNGYATSSMYGWEPNIGYRVGGYITDPDFIVETSLDTVPSSSVTLTSKKTSNLTSSWITALRVSTVQVGANSQRTGNAYVPKADGSDWVFRIDGFNKHHNSINFYTFNKNGNFNTFNALEKAHTGIDWKQFTESASLQTVTLPITIVGIQNVINFVFGYEAWLKEQGWDFDKKVQANIDQTHSRYVDFQLVLEKFIDGIYAGGKVGSSGILNPIAAGVWFNHGRGLLSSFVEHGLFDPITDSAAYDMFGLRVKQKDLVISRQREQSLISANTPIFSIHAEIDAYEHLMVFNRFMNPVDEQGVLYAPFAGSIVSFLKMNGKIQSSRTLRPEIGGYILNGGNVIRNIESSISAYGKMYDANSVFEHNDISENALALYGYSEKQYMKDLDYTEKTQFNFWRGMVHSKGTNMSFEAFKNGNRFDDVNLDEYWAFKIAEYGDSRTKNSPELILTDLDCQQQFTKISFGEKLDGTFTSINPNDETRWFAAGDLGKLSEFTVKTNASHNITITESDVTNGVIFTFPNGGDFVSHTSNLTKLNHLSFIGIAAGEANVTYSFVDSDRHSPVSLINYVDKETVQTIPVWHPAIGQHNPYVLPAIDIISPINPALYNYSTIIDGNVNYDPFRKWGANEVGTIWFDTSNVDYLQYNNTDRFVEVGERLNRWGALAEYASVNVAEWVESDIDPATYLTYSKSNDTDLKTDGIPYAGKTYQRYREWSIAPIAWSKSGVPNKNAHPSFNGAFNSTLNFRSNGVASLEYGTFAALGITSGMRIGAWRDDIEFTGPLNEFLIPDNSFTKFFMRDDDEFYSNTISVNSNDFELSLSVGTYTDTTGDLELVYDPLKNFIETPLTNFDGTLSGRSEYSIFVSVYCKTFIGDALVGSIVGPSGAEPNYTLPEGGVMNIILPNGLSVNLLSQTTFVGKLSDIASSLDTFFVTPILVEDAVALEEVTFNSLEVLVELPFPTTLTNNPEDPRYLSNFGCGWRAWNTPTQADLDDDSAQPDSVWKPYIGKYKTIASPSIALINDAIANDAMVLNDGTEVKRYSTSWSEWAEMKDLLYKSTSVLGGDHQVLVDDKYDISRLFVYKNGIRQVPGSFYVYGSAIVVPNTNTGDEIRIRISKYEPTDTELAFDPDVSDDLKRQIHYKLDYEYVEVPVRSIEGSIIGKKYYFWVTNKTTTKSKLPTTTITDLITDGPSQYVTFPTEKSLVVYGLNHLVTRNDTFKLRLVNDHTLRMDPNGLDLKDVHQEWTLIRKDQRKKVPVELWDKVVDSLCGENIAGDELPFRSIQEYDSRNGTTTVYGFDQGQVLAPREVLVKTIMETIINTKVTVEFDLTKQIDFISSDILDWNSPETWFDTPENTRKTMERIWFKARPAQINEIVFAAIDDACVFIQEMTHLIKTSRLSAYSIKVIQPSSASEEYE